MNFTNSRDGNDFTTDTRPLTMIYGLVRTASKEALSAVKDEELRGYLENPHTKESQDFFWELFDTCNRKWIPDYYQFALKRWREDAGIS